MPSKQLDFRRFLEKKAQEHSQTEQRSQKEDWIVAVTGLIHHMSEWIGNADKKKVLDVVQRGIDRYEEGLGAYRVPTLEISLGDAQVQVVPIGRNVVGVIGAKGLVGERAQ